MIVFDGLLDGKAQQFYHKKGMVFGYAICFVAAIVLMPLIIKIASFMQNWHLIWIYFIFMMSWPLIMDISKTKRDKISFTPRKIYIKDDQIVCIADKYTETKYIEDVKCVYDHGEFYELTFPFGKISDKYICQKKLLIEGSIEEFEELFGGKIVKK